MPVQLSALSVEWRGEIPMLLEYDGSEFPGVAYVRNYIPPENRTFAEVILRADNARAFSVVGDDKEYINAFTLECWGDACKRAVTSAVARESSHGLFVLEVPDTDSSALDRYLIRFFGEAGNLGFSRVYPRRAGFIPVYSADITEIEVLGHQSL